MRTSVKRTKSSHPSSIKEPKSGMGRRNSKRLKDDQSEAEMSNIDLLSRLPECILCHIISFLDTRSAIRTSVLSKRYNLLWTQLQSLDFNSAYISSIQDNRDIPDKVALFESQVSSVLLRRENTNLTTFRLSLHHEVRAEFVKDCIEYAAIHKVQHLIIRSVIRRRHLLLPRSLLISSSLISLRLNNALSFSIDLPAAVNLPNLKVLHLKKFEFSGGTYKSDLFPGCPSLENLVLHKCTFRPDHKLKVLDINCSKLRNLEIKQWRSPWSWFDECMINVNAPKLVCFKFQSYIARVVFKERLSCLDSIYIDLSYPTSCASVVMDERKQKTAEIFLSMLWRLRNIKFLSLSWNTVKVLSVVPDLRLRSPITFVNLRFINFIAESKHTELRIPVQTLRQSSETVTDDIFVINVPEKVQNAETKHEDAGALEVPANVMHYLLENSPSAEFFFIEIPEDSSDEDKWKNLVS